MTQNIANYGFCLTPSQTSSVLDQCFLLSCFRIQRERGRFIHLILFRSIHHVFTEFFFQSQHFPKTFRHAFWIYEITSLRKLIENSMLISVSSKAQKKKRVLPGRIAYGRTYSPMKQFTFKSTCSLTGLATQYVFHSL